MKKRPLITATLCLLTFGLNAQVSGPTNNGSALPQFVGYNGLFPLNTKPLDINNGYNNQPIRFYTNNSGSQGNAFATQRMTITPAGLVGIGNL